MHVRGYCYFNSDFSQINISCKTTEKRILGLYTILVNITGYYFILRCIGNYWLIMHYIPKGAYTFLIYLHVHVCNRCCCKVNVYQNDYIFAAAILVSKHLLNVNI